MKALGIRAKALVCAALIAVSSPASCSDWSMLDPVDLDPSVFGSVRDARTGAALAGATVTVQGRSVTSDDQGKYSIDKLPGGKTQLTAQRAGYKDYAAEITVGIFTMHEIGMEPK